MLFFYAAGNGDSRASVDPYGVHAEDGHSLDLHSSLDAAQRATDGRILVIDAADLGIDPNTVESPHVSHIPPDAIRNLEPYRPPTAVTAAGGYVGCALPNDVALLLIFRRGVWDLPKGKRDRGEDVETCARREVQEEIGIDAVEILRPLGTTVHGYADGARYVVKTTHWFLMRTSARSFQPERREGIQRVRWARWEVAYRHIGYENLRRHMQRIETDVRDAFA